MVKTALWQIHVRGEPGNGNGKENRKKQVHGAKK